MIADHHQPQIPPSPPFHPQGVRRGCPLRAAALTLSKWGILPIRSSAGFPIFKKGARGDLKYSKSYELSINSQNFLAHRFFSIAKNFPA